MRGLTGLTLVLVGVATAIYGTYPESEDRQAALDRWVGVFGMGSLNSSASSERASVTEIPLVVVDPERRAFSPQAPLFQQVPVAGAPQAIERTKPAAQASVATAAVATAATLASQMLPGPAAAQAGQPSDVDASAAVADLSSNASSVVTPTDRQPSPLRHGITSAKPGGEDAQRELARNLQKELKRVGCYDGEINGSWSQASRRAMKAFTERVNATLPVEEPDYILLTLVQGHSAEACGVGCPADQVLAKDGKCLPRAIVAQAANKNAKRSGPPKVAAAKPVAQPTTDAKAPAKTANRSPEVGRALEMWAKVTPQAPVGAVVEPNRAANSGGWQTATISARPAPIAAPVALPSPAVAPLPGRMAIGGPVAKSTELAAAAPGVTDARAVAPPVAEPAPASSGAYPLAGQKPDAKPTAGPEARRLPRHVVERERSGSRRVKSYDSVAPAYAPKPVQTSKAARVRAMHYNLFNRPDRVTN